MGIKTNKGFKITITCMHCGSTDVVDHVIWYKCNNCGRYGEPDFDSEIQDLNNRIDLELNKDMNR